MLKCCIIVVSHYLRHYQAHNRSYFVTIYLQFFVIIINLLVYIRRHSFYKLAEIESMPRMKISGNPEKTTNPGRKQVWRIWSKEGREKAGKDPEAMTFVTDIIGLEEEDISPLSPLQLKDGERPWTPLTLEPGSFEAKPLLVRLAPGMDGSLPGSDPLEGRTNLKLEMGRIRPQCSRLVNPEPLKVSLSARLARLKGELIEHYRPKSHS